MSSLSLNESIIYSSDLTLSTLVSTYRDYSLSTSTLSSPIEIQNSFSFSETGENYIDNYTSSLDDNFYVINPRSNDSTLIFNFEEPEILPNLRPNHFVRRNAITVESFDLIQFIDSLN